MALIDRLATRAGAALMDVHRDPDHHRSVFTLAGDDAACEAAARAVAEAAVAAIDVGKHAGEHPRLGSVDVVPFVPLLPDALPDALGGADLSAACAARDRFCAWMADHLGVPCFCYGPLAGGERSLVEIRRHAFDGLAPDAGPLHPHPRAGAVCVGARRALIAYNLVLSTPDPAIARRLAAALRSPAVRALGFVVTAGAQVSCNLVAPWSVGPSEVFARLARLAAPQGVRIVATELVGLLPRSLVEAIPPSEWPRLDLGLERTLEARLSRGRPSTERGAAGGSTPAR